MPSLNPYFFERQFEAFRSYIQAKSGMNFLSFASNPYTVREEGYKYQLWDDARSALNIQSWQLNDIGSGQIAKAVRSSIELPNNNLVTWLPRFGELSQPHRKLLEAIKEGTNLAEIEMCLYRLYRNDDDEASFNNLTKIFGKKYALIAYLYFVKDRSRYLPIMTTYFEKAFALLGAEFTATAKCSWANYQLFLSLLQEVKTMLMEALNVEVTILDAHSFAWILVNQMQEDNMLADMSNYFALTESERDALVKARVGQGRFREALISYWLTCAVTGCTERQLLIASHIKPWAEGTTAERLDAYNGLLLSPALDATFDCGLISFADDGKIMISERLKKSDQDALTINPSMTLRKIDQKHKVYLQHHRTYRFK